MQLHDSILWKHRESPSRMQMVLKYFYPEVVFTDQKPDTPLIRWRARNVYEDETTSQRIEDNGDCSDDVDAKALSPGQSKQCPFFGVNLAVLLPRAPQPALPDDEAKALCLCSPQSTLKQNFSFDFISSRALEPKRKWTSQARACSFGELELEFEWLFGGSKLGPVNTFHGNLGEDLLTDPLDCIVFGNQESSEEIHHADGAKIRRSQRRAQRTGRRHHRDHETYSHSTKG
ncbi:hypothetical protein MA16_Dca023356 [Dendrobium catenatum]|uniref:Uncharacterized protein n=1 Tax=Dendrobium catenatum TaxID=906689 RepID=A0A2I0WP54_9ASPA|nr:hypothetical protein MA16_Dca023356 [Dendrobium catenatum]